MRFSFASILAVSAPLLVSAAPFGKRTAAAAAPPAAPGKFSDTDILVLQFAHVLEQLETAFYNQALAKFQDSDFQAAGFSTPSIPIEQFKSIVADEQTHADVLAQTIKAIGGEPITGCTFNFDKALGDVATMGDVARLVEDVGVGAYLGAATLISDPNLLTAAASILTVEARHQTILNLLIGGTAIPQAFDIPLGPEQVMALVSPIISGCTIPLPANPPLTIANGATATTVVVGQSLDLQSDALQGIPRENLTCQMLVGGAAFALAFPIDECVVPDGINGPVAVFVTNSTQPLLTAQRDQFRKSVVAGPQFAFVDTQPQTINALVRTPQNGDAPTIPSTATISPAEASAVVTGASGDPTAATTLTAPDPAATTGASPAVAAAGQANLATGPSKDGALNVNGWTTIPAASVTASPNA
jgi:hypothetical protein